MPNSDHLQRDLSHLPVDQRGHNHAGALDIPIHATQPGVMDDGEPRWLPPLVNWFDCRKCSGYPAFDLISDESGEPVSFVSRTVCSLPDGITTTTVIDIPSGKLIVDDDLRPVYDWVLRPGEPDYGSFAGQAEAVKQMGEQGCAYGPTLNTSPSLIKTGDDAYVIASVDSEAAEGEPGHFAGPVLATICTDLWAYSIADYEHWKTRLLELFADSPDRFRSHSVLVHLIKFAESGGNPDLLPATTTVVDVTPGSYRFTYHGGEPGFEHEEYGSVLAHIEKVR